jgi:hypothetical protein
MKKTALLFLLVLVIQSCDWGRRSDTNDPKVVLSDLSAPEGELMTPPPPPAEEQLPNTIYKTKVIKDGQMGIKVTDLEKTKTRIDSLVARNGGYYANESLSNYDSESSYNLKIRIPSKNLDKFILGIESGKSQILYKNIEVRDVTEEFIDLETRLENKRNYLIRYNELLKQAKTVKDILEIEEKTRAIEEEIESTEGRLKYLGDQVDFSTLELRISKEKDFKFIPSNKTHFGERLKQSLSNGWHGFVEFFLFLLKLWPFWIILIIIIPVWKRYRTKKKNKS